MHHEWSKFKFPQILVPKILSTTVTKLKVIPLDDYPKNGYI